MPSRARHSPLLRVVSLMRVLTQAHREHGQHKVFTDAELMEQVPAYGTGSDPVRTLNHDKAALRARGLIVTNQPHPYEGHRKGTRRASFLEKQDSLWLTADEHRVLRQAREARLSRAHFPVGPTAAPEQAPGRTNASVDDALRLLRLLEESGGEVSVEMVADCFGIGERRARNWLVQMADGFDDSSLVEVLYTSDNDEDPTNGDENEPVVRAVALKTDEASQYPFAHTGTALLGLFGYSRGEVDERLGLIAEHRAMDAPDATTEALLASIEHKLAAWAAQLPA